MGSQLHLNARQKYCSHKCRQAAYLKRECDAAIERAKWLLHSKVKINWNFVQGLTEFYQSHKKVADTTNTTCKGTIKWLLVVDEFPSLLADLKAKDKRNYDMIVAMLRSIYSQGSHTNHNLMLLSQTVLNEDIGLSSNDKAKFIQCCLGALGGDYLMGNGQGVHWPDVDEDISAMGMLYGIPAPRPILSGQKSMSVIAA